MISKHNSLRSENLYRVYLTDIMYLHGKGQTLTYRYSEMLRPVGESSGMSGDDIAYEVITKMGLTFKEGG